MLDPHHAQAPAPSRFSLPAGEDAKLSRRDADHRRFMPEVYLDESYVNQNHVASRSWLDKSRKRYAKEGKGNRFCIIGAGGKIY